MAEPDVRYVTIGDPVADAAVAELARNAGPAEVHRIITTALDNHERPPAGTPEALQHVIADAGTVPDWFDCDLAREATGAFLCNSEMVLGALLGGAIIEGFSTLISESFRIRGRSLADVVRAFRVSKDRRRGRPMCVDCDDALRGQVFSCMLACCAEWHMRRKLAPLLYRDEDPAAGQVQRDSRDGVPVRSFPTLLGDLGDLSSA